MTDLEALHRAVLEHPDDDTPRLISADALEESGETERAAFIRAQVAADRVPDWDPVAIHFRLRELPAMGGWPLDTLPELPPGLKWVEEPFRRGFPAAVEAGDGAAFVEHFEKLFSLAPVQELHLDAIPLPNVERLVKCRGLERIAKLVLREGAIGLTAERLLASPHLARLDDLYLGAQMSTDSTEVAVVRSAVFPRLTAFGCRNVRWPELLFAEMARLQRRPRLMQLDLAGNSLTIDSRPPDFDQRRDQFRDFLHELLWNGLESLELSENNLGPGGVEAVSSCWGGSLKSLSLRQTRPEADGLRALCNAGFSLFSLNLAGNNLHRWAGALIAKSERFDQLRIIDLSENRLGDPGVAALAESKGLTNLLLLDVRNNGLTDAGIARLRDRFGDRVLA